MHTAKGGGRSELSMFIHTCLNKVHGCKSAFSSLEGLRQHLPTCSTDADMLVQRAKAKERLPHHVDGCHKLFSTKTTLKTRLQTYEGKARWEPRPCIYGCDPRTAYTSKRQLQKHINITHSGYQPTSCRYPGCKSTEVSHPLHWLSPQSCGSCAIQSGLGGLVFCRSLQ